MIMGKYRIWKGFSKGFSTNFIIFQKNPEGTKFLKLIESKVCEVSERSNVLKKWPNAKRDLHILKIQLCDYISR